MKASSPSLLLILFAAVAALVSGSSGSAYDPMSDAGGSSVGGVDGHHHDRRLMKCKTKCRKRKGKPQKNRCKFQRVVVIVEVVARCAETFRSLPPSLYPPLTNANEIQVSRYAFKPVARANAKIYRLTRKRSDPSASAFASLRTPRTRIERAPKRTSNAVTRRSAAMDWCVGTDE